MKHFQNIQFNLNDIIALVDITSGNKFRSINLVLWIIKNDFFRLNIHLLVKNEFSILTTIPIVNLNVFTIRISRI